MSDKHFNRRTIKNRLIVSKQLALSSPSVHTIKMDILHKISLKIIPYDRNGAINARQILLLNASNLYLLPYNTHNIVNIICSLIQCEIYSLSGDKCSFHLMFSVALAYTSSSAREKRISYTIVMRSFVCLFLLKFTLLWLLLLHASSSNFYKCKIIFWRHQTRIWNEP